MKKKILIITTNSPYPLSHGGAIAQYFFLEKLVEDFEVDLIAILQNERDRQNLFAIQNRIKNLKIITYLPSTKKKNIKYFLKLLFIFLYNHFWKQNRGESEISESFNYVNSDFSNFIKNHFSENEYDICQLEFFETLKFAPLIPSSLKKIFVHHEIRFKKYRNTLDLNNIFHKNIVISSKICEIAFLALFDKIIVFNSEDLTELNELLPKVEVIPFGLPDELIINKNPSLGFQYFFFLGAESHRPNSDGLEWFLDNIFIPEFKNINKPIKISGKWSDKYIFKYAKYEFIQFTGFVNSLEQFYLEGILVAPILSGSGIRTKILEAMANHVPIICTSFAAEGLFNENNNDHLLFFNDRISFMEKVNNELNNLETRKKIVKKANIFFESNFNSLNIYNRRLNLYNTLISTDNLIEDINK